MPWSHLLFYFLLMHYPIIAKFSIKSIPFFKKIKVFFRYFLRLWLKEQENTIYGGARNPGVEPEKYCPWGLDLHDEQMGVHSGTAEYDHLSFCFRKKRCQVSNFTANKGFPSLFSENKRLKKVKRGRKELCKQKNRERLWRAVEKVCGKTCGDCGKV